jgi:ActR/RegA family two-component response regulator
MLMANQQPPELTQPGVGSLHNPAAFVTPQLAPVFIATVGEALREITSQKFDVLISDLNIGQAGDGFTVVSAIRRTQPECMTIILTGYPALESALQAIGSQVDDYLIKPAAIPELVSGIEARLKDPARRRLTPSKRISELLHENVATITDRVLEEMKNHLVLGTLALSDAERVDALPVLIRSLAQQLESPDPDHVPKKALKAAAVRGETRRQQGYNVTMLIENIRLFERIVFDTVHENLLALNLSYLMVDLKRLNDSLGLQLQATVVAFLEGKDLAA